MYIYIYIYVYIYIDNSIQFDSSVQFDDSFQEHPQLWVECKMIGYAGGGLKYRCILKIRFQNDAQFEIVIRRGPSNNTNHLRRVGEVRKEDIQQRGGRGKHEVRTV